MNRFARKTISSLNSKRAVYRSRWMMSMLQYYGSTYKFPLVFFAASAAVVGCYVLEWKVVVTKIPYYRQQFKDETST